MKKIENSKSAAALSAAALILAGLSVPVASAFATGGNGVEHTAPAGASAKVKIAKNTSDENEPGSQYIAYKILDATIDQGSVVHLPMHMPTEPLDETQEGWEANVGGHAVTGRNFALPEQGDIVSIIGNAVTTYTAKSSSSAVRSEMTSDWAAVSGNPQKIAEFLSKYLIGEYSYGDRSAINAGTYGSFADALVRAAIAQNANNTLTNDKKLMETTIYAGDEGAILDDGYYIIVPADVVDAPTGAEGDTGYYGVAGSSAIFVAAGGDDITITEKRDVPTLTKTVAEKNIDTTSGVVYGAYGDSANYTIGDEVHYKLYGTVPSNINSYESYKMVFTDTPPEGITIGENCIISVKAGYNTYLQEVLADDYEVAVDGTGKLTVTFDNICDLHLAAEPATNVSIGAGGNYAVQIEYKATLNTSAKILDPNQNVAQLEYSSNPYNAAETNKTVPDTAEVETYGFELSKVDAGTGNLVQSEAPDVPAKFTVKDAYGNYIAPDGNRVKTVATNKVVDGTPTEEETADGKVPLSSVKWSVGTDGFVKVVGIDEGMYTITETDAPTGYTGLTSSFDIMVTADVPTRPAGLEEGEPFDDSKQINVAQVGTANSLVSVDDAKITLASNDGGNNWVDAPNVKVGNYKGIHLPITGEQGFMLLTIAGGLVLALSLGSTVVRRRKSEDSEDSE